MRNKEKQFFPTNIICVKGAKVIAVLPAKKKNEKMKERKKLVRRKNL